MAIIVVKTREQLKNDPPVITHNPDGTLTRKGAVLEARALWGDLGTISSTEDQPRLVWCIGNFDRTVGRGRTWELAIERSKQRKDKLDQKQLALLNKEARDVIEVTG